MSSLPKDADDQEVFEIVDYTTASEWERFTANVEEILHDWQLTRSSTDCRHPSAAVDIKSPHIEWQEKTTSIKFSDYAFNMTHHFLTYNQLENVELQNTSDAVKEDKDDAQLPQYICDLMNMKNDFPGKAHCLVRWFGLREFVTIAPAISTQPITSPSKMRVVLSSLAMAANNTNCQVPLFLQINEIYDKIYLGVGFGSDVRTDFEMAYIKTPPPQCTHLSGLLDIFKSKIGSTLASAPVLVSIRFTYVLSDWPHTIWSQQPPDLDGTLTDVGFSELGKLPFGALSDPVSELQVSTTWPCMSEYSLIDSDVQSDLNPSSAPLWSARLGTSFAPPCLLSEYLAEFLQICENNQSIVQILGPDFDPTFDAGTNIINALDRLTSPIPSFAAVTSRVQSKPTTKVEQGPIAEETLSLLLNFLFPDAQSLQEESAPYSSSFSYVPNWTPLVEGLPTEHPLRNVLRKMKSCDVDSFVWRLSVVLCHVIHSLGGLSSVAHLLYEIWLELRFRWDNAIFVPGLEGGPPDMSSCIVNQKLQMLNCCIQHKIAREQKNEHGAADETFDEEEEFYECEEDVEQEDDSGKEYSSWDKPEGRLKRFGNARLFKKKDFIYIPITQEAAPNTEDMLEEQTGELLRLGSDPSGSCQRAKLMSASLLSDMESFKAANPGSLLEDFVRWYSPRDWIEEEVTGEDCKRKVQGRLSNRMLLPGNLWKEVWENAKPVPAWRQKRLFDDTREAEKVLQWFNQMSPGALCLELLPVVMHASLCRITEEPVLYTLSAVKEESLPRPLHDDTLAAQLELLAKRVSRLSRHPSNIAQYKSVYLQVEIIERCIAKAQSLRRKLLGHVEVSPASIKTYFASPADSEDTPRSDRTSSNEAGLSSTAMNLSPLESLVMNLLQFSEVTLEGGSKGLQASVIKKLFLDARDAAYSDEPSLADSKKIPSKLDSSDTSTSRDIELGKPVGREYLLRAQAAFPADHSRVLPQRLYAVILKKSFRMAGAITQDTLFC